MANQSLIDYIVGMQAAGMSDSEIISRLKDEGYTAKDINDSLNQSKVKMAISAGGQEEEEMQPSITEQEIPVPSPQAQPMPRERKAQVQQPQYGEAYPTYQYPEAQAMPAAPPQKTDTEYIQEITEEIINEKWRDFRKKIGPIEEVKSDVEKRIAVVEDKIIKIEEMMDKMQISILGKIQEYGRSIESVGSEVRAIEGNISRMISPLVSNIKELKKEKPKKA